MIEVNKRILGYFILLTFIVFFSVGVGYVWGWDNKAKDSEVVYIEVAEETVTNEWGEFPVVIYEHEEQPTAEDKLIEAMVEGMFDHLARADIKFKFDNNGVSSGEIHIILK